MLITPLPRAKLFELLPQNLEIAEIGVARGEFSRSILNACNPKLLRMIDPWVYQDVEHLKADGNNPEQFLQDGRHDQVIKDFASEIAEGRVVVDRAFSHIAAERIEDGSLDIVYIDGDHSYDGVMRDLTSFAPKIKSGGLIMGHDYTVHPKIEFGVVQAVNDFVLANNYEFLVLTINENFPTWAIAAEFKGTARTFMELIAKRVRGVVEVTGFPRDITFEPKYVQQEGAAVNFVPSFAPTKG